MVKGGVGVTGGGASGRRVLVGGGGRWVAVGGGGWRWVASSTEFVA